VEIAGFKVTAIKSSTSSSMRIRFSVPLPRYVVEVNGASFYHSGDCIPTRVCSAHWPHGRDSMEFLPINGRDAERFLPTARETYFPGAAEIAAS